MTSEVLEEYCRYCCYKFKPNDGDICPLCCASRDTYSNIAKEKGVSRNFVKAYSMAAYYGVSPKKYKPLTGNNTHNRRS